MVRGPWFEARPSFEARASGPRAFRMTALATHHDERVLNGMVVAVISAASINDDRRTP